MLAYFVYKYIMTRWFVATQYNNKPPLYIYIFTEELLPFNERCTDICSFCTIVHFQVYLTWGSTLCVVCVCFFLKFYVIFSHLWQVQVHVMWTLTSFIIFTLNIIYIINLCLVIRSSFNIYFALSDGFYYL